MNARRFIEQEFLSLAIYTNTHLLAKDRRKTYTVCGTLGTTAAVAAAVAADFGCYKCCSLNVYNECTCTLAYLYTDSSSSSFAAYAEWAKASSNEEKLKKNKPKNVIKFNYDLIDCCGMFHLFFGLLFSFRSFHFVHTRLFIQVCGCTADAGRIHSSQCVSEWVSEGTAAADVVDVVVIFSGSNSTRKLIARNRTA